MGIAVLSQNSSPAAQNDKSDGLAMTAASPWAETDRNGIISRQMEVENGKDSLDI